MSQMRFLDIDWSETTSAIELNNIDMHKLNSINQTGKVENP